MNIEQKLQEAYSTELPKHYYLLTPIAVLDPALEKTTSWRS